MTLNIFVLVLPMSADEFSRSAYSELYYSTSTKSKCFLCIHSAELLVHIYLLLLNLY